MPSAPEPSPIEEPKPGQATLKKPFGLGTLPPLPGLMLTVFLDLLAFGMFIPDLQLRGKEFGLSGFALGLLFSSYSIAQVIAAPWLGQLSDGKGRRIVLIVSSTLSCLSYLVYANLHHSIVLLTLSRVLLGIASANLGVAFAYAADISTEEDRAKSVGALGASVGVGFIVGPVIGAILLKLGGGGTHVLGLSGATLVFINLLYIIFFLPEPVRTHTVKEKSKAFDSFKIAFKTPSLAILLVMLTVLGLGFTNLESTFFLLLGSPHSVFHLADNTARTVGSYLLGTVGVCSALSQGVFTRFLTPRLGEALILRICYPVMGISILMVPFFPLWAPAFLACGCLAFSSGLSNPCLNSLLSKAAPPELQGSVFGISQSLQGFARLFGPLISLPLFAVNVHYPYALGAVLIFVASAISYMIRLTPVNNLGLESVKSA